MLFLFLFRIEEPLDLFDFLGGMDGAASVQVKIPLEDFLVGLEVIDDEFEPGSDYVSFIAKFLAMMAKHGDFIVHKGKDCRKPLFAIHQNSWFVESFEPTGIIPVNGLSTRASPKNKFTKPNLLVNGPYVAPLEIRVHIESFARLGVVPRIQLFFEVLPTNINPVVPISGELRNG